MFFHLNCHLHSQSLVVRKKCGWSFSVYSKQLNLVGGVPTPLKNISPNIWKKKLFQTTTNQGWGCLGVHL
jgi:hypothetical protein